jgi:carbonic anhydrase
MQTQKMSGFFQGPGLCQLVLAGAVALGAAGAWEGVAEEADAGTRADRSPELVIGAERPATRDPEEAKRLLAEGNARFAMGETLAPRLRAEHRRAQVEGQAPFAVVLSCSDSRAPVDMVFDQDPGNLFVVRVAGNLATPVTLGSIEYALKHLGPAVLVVMGHQACGAVMAAKLPSEKTRDEPKNVRHILEQIRPALERAETGNGDPLQAREAIVANVREQMRTLNSNPVVREAVRAGSIEVVGAYFDLASGKVEFLGKESR